MGSSSSANSHLTHISTEELPALNKNGRTVDHVSPSRLPRAARRLHQDRTFIVTLQTEVPFADQSYGWKSDTNSAKYTRALSARIHRAHSQRMFFYFGLFGGSISAWVVVAWQRSFILYQHLFDYRPSLTSQTFTGSVALELPNSGFIMSKQTVLMGNIVVRVVRIRVRKSCCSCDPKGGCRKPENWCVQRSILERVRISAV